MTEETLFIKYMAKFGPYFRKIARIMADNHELKGDSWKTMSWADLMDGLCKQIEDMQDDPDREDYYGNIGCYSGMLWLRASSEGEKP